MWLRRMLDATESIVVYPEVIAPLFSWSLKKFQIGQGIYWWHVTSILTNKIYKKKSIALILGKNFLYLT